MIKKSLTMTGSATRKPRLVGGDKGRNKQISSLPGSPALRAGIFTIAALILLGAHPAPLPASDTQFESIARNPTLVYQKAFGIDTTPEIWHRVLDNLYLMGQLWGSYRFQPAYRVTRTDSGLHVDDPTGIAGDVRPAGGTVLSRSFTGQGKFNHWAVPSFFTAEGAIMFECTRERNGLRGEVKIFLLGTNWVSRAAITLFSGTLTRHIDNRFTSNMDNMKRIIRDVADEPDRVRNGLAGPLRDEFDKAFP